MIKIIKNSVVEYFINDNRNGLLNINYNKICAMSDKNDKVYFPFVTFTFAEYYNYDDKIDTFNFTIVLPHINKTDNYDSDNTLFDCIIDFIRKHECYDIVLNREAERLILYVPTESITISPISNRVDPFYYDSMPYVENNDL